MGGSGKERSLLKNGGSIHSCSHRSGEDGGSRVAECTVGRSALCEILGWAAHQRLPGRHIGELSS